MRCKNCGWENPGDKQKCEKCNAPLSGSMIENNTPSNRSSYASIAENLKGTVPESGGGIGLAGENEQPVNAPSDCPVCHYPLRPAMTTCPNCSHDLSGKNRVAPPKQGKTCPSCAKPMQPGAQFCPYCGASAQKQQAPFRMGTVNSWESPQQGTFCTLKPLPWRGEEVIYQPISYSGAMISLNRANTDPNNNTITSKEQAVLICEAGEWYLENRSEQQTTFLRVGKRVKLENGDVVVLGNRLFEFKE